MMPDQGITFNLDFRETPVLIGAIALVVWGIAERLFSCFRLHQPKSAHREKLSFYLCVVSWYGAVMFSLLDAIEFHCTTISPSLAWVRFVGIPFVGAGIIIRIVSRLTLGRQFSAHVQTSEHHTLVTTGIYAWVRHPAYLAYICLLIGFPVCFGSMGAFLGGILFGIPAVLYRMRIEEVALLEWFGNAYQQYAKTTCRLVPLLW